jgi:hypothetical protein
MNGAGAGALARWRKCHQEQTFFAAFFQKRSAFRPAGYILLCLPDELRVIRRSFGRLH